MLEIYQWVSRKKRTTLFCLWFGEFSSGFFDEVHWRFHDMIGFFIGTNMLFISQFFSHRTLTFYVVLSNLWVKVAFSKLYRLHCTGSYEPSCFLIANIIVFAICSIFLCVKPCIWSRNFSAVLQGRPLLFFVYNYPMRYYFQILTSF